MDIQELQAGDLDLVAKINHNFNILSYSTAEYTLELDFGLTLMLRKFGNTVECVIVETTAIRVPKSQFGERYDSHRIPDGFKPLDNRKLEDIRYRPLFYESNLGTRDSLRIEILSDGRIKWYFFEAEKDWEFASWYILTDSSNGYFRLFPYRTTWVSNPSPNLVPKIFSGEYRMAEKLQENFLEAKRTAVPKIGVEKLVDIGGGVHCFFRRFENRVEVISFWPQLLERFDWGVTNLSLENKIPIGFRPKSEQTVSFQRNGSTYLNDYDFNTVPDLKKFNIHGRGFTYVKSGTITFLPTGSVKWSRGGYDNNNSVATEITPFGGSWQTDDPFPYQLVEERA